VVDDLKAKGAVFVSEIDEIPAGGVTIFSAHGVADKVEQNARAAGLNVIDATCPLVTKVHIEAIKYEKEGREIILIGHKGHPEVEGTSGRVREVILVENAEDVQKISPKNPSNLAYVTQTTLSVDDTRVIIDALKTRFPAIKGPDTKDICYATQNRQNAVRELAKHVNIILVIGAANSSNSNRLRDLGEELGVRSHLIAGPQDIDNTWFAPKSIIGLTAGASAPEVLVEAVIERLKQLGTNEVTILDGVIENVKFKLPMEVG
jgi:4-hydroxy-3-methylbut-2-enyl diphosphate reductase